MYLTIVISGIKILVLFRILSFLNKILPFSRGVKHYTGYILPVVELASWLGFVIWCIRFIYEANDYIALIIPGTLATLFIVQAWSLLRDFLYGVILKVQRKIDVGYMVEIESIKGAIIKTGHFNFDIKTKNGNIDTIPYSKIRFKIISKPSANKHLEKQLISFRIPSTQDINKVMPRLKTTLLNAPWVAVSQYPIITDIKQVNNEYIVDVFVYTLKKGHVENIRDYVVKNFIQLIT